MSLADWNLRVITIASVWGALVGLLFNYAVFADPGNPVGLWIAVLLGFGAVYYYHTRMQEGPTEDTGWEGT